MDSASQHDNIHKLLNNLYAAASSAVIDSEHRLNKKNRVKSGGICLLCEQLLITPSCLLSGSGENRTLPETFTAPSAQKNF